MRATRLLAAIVLLALAACTMAPSPSNDGGAELAVPGSDPSSVPPSPSPTSAAIGSMAPGGGSIDPSIEPVSLSAPSADARSAMDACYADAIGLDKIDGIGQIAHARDAPKYAPLHEGNPELQTDAPAWVISFGGRVTLPRGLGWADGVVCVVVDDRPTFFVVGDHGRGDKQVDFSPPPEPPPLTLPAPLP